MKWSLFSFFAAGLIMGNILVHAQAIPNLPSTPTIPTRIPDQALQSLNIPPEMVSRLPIQAQREAALRQAKIRDEILQTAREQNPVAHGGIPLATNDTSQSPTATDANGTTGPSGDAPTPTDTASSSPVNAGHSALALSTSYLQTDNALTEANIAQTLALATDADIRLWKGYYDDMYDKVEELKRSYEHVRDSLRRYGDKVSSMLNRLPATIISCTR